MLSGAGETTCGNTRCPLHGEFPDGDDDVRPALTTLELPFSYAEHGQSKFALVKVVLCPKCCKKLMWKRNKEKEERDKWEGGHVDEVSHEATEAGGDVPDERYKRRRRSGSPIDEMRDRDEHARKRRAAVDDTREPRRKRSSRSRSPHSRKEDRSRRSP